MKRSASSPLKTGFQLTDQAFFILVSLASGRKHGYAILKDIEQLSQGFIRLSTSTLYGALGRLQDQGLIEHLSIDEPEDTSPGLPRKFYALTETGRRVLEAETDRLHALVQLARMRLTETQA